MLAWVVLGIAFTLFIGRPEIIMEGDAAVTLFAICLLTAGVGFLVHELAHKVVAIRLHRPATFRADYSLLLITMLSALAGFLFAAPGAVYHRGPANTRAHGLVAVAGPISNLVLLVVFLPLTILPDGFIATVGSFGIWINALLAAFNMLPIGPLDGRTVLSWHPGVFIVVFSVCAGCVAFAVFAIGLVPW